MPKPSKSFMRLIPSTNVGLDMLYFFSASLVVSSGTEYPSEIFIIQSLSSPPIGAGFGSGSSYKFSLFSYGFSVYIDYFNGFSMYGSLTTIALLMLWLYFCGYILLICGEINNNYEDYWVKYKREWQTKKACRFIKAMLE